MNTLYAAQTTDDNPIPYENVMTKKLKKTAPHVRKNQSPLTKRQSKTLQILQKNADKLYVFNCQLAQLIDAIPNTILLKDRDGRKLITNKLTKRLFKLHDLAWYGKTASKPSEIGTDHDRMSLESELHFALAKRQLKLYYQIQVDSNSQIFGAEALLRWEHPQYGLIAPEQFISIAEQTALILPIGAWVLQTACKQLKLWQNDPLKKDLSLAVNISPRQFSHPEFVEHLRQLLKKTGINAALLKLELTESLMLHDIANTIEKMEKLNQLGVRFSMDNFGTGYSSFSHLKKLPIDQLKIDQFLMRDIAIDSCDAMIVKTIIDMTHKLGINMISGCVETEQQFACLKQLGCTAYQGFLFGKPMPLDEFEKRISVAA
ncbi:MAG TPA: EAL domain-containing protein [Methylobacter sp.]|jgi:EAL domain-containing protein (putative c-di-GMP-specific phosphodiesterase class I)